VGLHGARHTAATIMLELGVNPRVVADWLGHADVALKLRRNSHVTETMEADAAARLARALDG
jgi:integrase